MRRRLQLVLLLFVAAGVCHAGDLIDGIVVTVNNVPILRSDVDDEVRFEAFVNGRPSSQIAASDRKAALERLIDQELLRQQMGKTFVHATPDEIAARLRDIREQIPGAQSDAGCHEVLRRYGLTEAQVTDRLATQIEITHFLDARLRADLRIERAKAEAYYRDTLLPQLQESGAPAVALADVYSRIEEVLRQQRVDDLLSTWLRDLRERSRIQYTSKEAPKDASATAR